MNFNKTAKTFSDQVALLKSRGLKIEDVHRAEKILSNISYYRLSAYLLTFQRFNDSTHTYMQWATFNKVVKLYMFDRKLRSICLDSIERIEVAVRCRIVYEYCHSHGNNWYEDPTLFSFKKGNHKEFMERVNKELRLSKEAFITHYKKTYTNPKNPPAWMTMEVMSFGFLSTMYKNLKANSAKKAIANHFGVGVPIMESWLEHLTYIRNLCAHHSRLWNRTMTITAMLPKVAPSYKWINIPSSKKDKVYTTICIIAYLSNRSTETSYFAGEIRALFRRFNEVDINAAGFPKDWEKDNFWKSSPILLTYRIRLIVFGMRNYFRKKFSI